MNPRRGRRTVGMSAGVLMTAVAAILVNGGVAGASTAYQFLTIDYPGGTSGTQDATVINGVTDSGVLVGTYFAGAVPYGFLQMGSELTPFNYPGAAATEPSGINASDSVAGVYMDSAGVNHGFIRFANGTFDALNAPGAGSAKNQGTLPENINDKGVVVGNFIDSRGVSHGFIYANGSFTRVDAPGAGSAPGEGTVVNDENDAGTIVGNVYNAQDVSLGFVDDDGDFTIFSAPGAGTKAGQGTIPLAISGNGTIVGYLVSASGLFQGWFQRAERFTPLNDPSAGTTPPLAGTLPLNISPNSEDVVGTYVDTHQTLEGFYVYIGR